MNWHLSGQSSLWRLDEGDYLIHLGRRYWSRRDENGEFTHGNASHGALSRTQPAPAEVNPSFPSSKRVTRTFEQPKGGFGMRRFAQAMMRMVSEAEGWPDPGEISDHQMHSIDGDLYRTSAKKHTAIALAQIAAKDSAALAAHEEWLRTSHLQDKSYPTLSPEFLSMVGGGNTLPPVLRDSPFAFRMEITEDMWRRVNAFASRLRITPAVKREIMGSLRGEILMSLPNTQKYLEQNKEKAARARYEIDVWREQLGTLPQFDPDSPRYRELLLKEHLRMIKRAEYDLEYYETKAKNQEALGADAHRLRDMKPADPSFADDIEAFAQKHKAALANLGDPAGRLSDSAKRIEAIREMSRDPAFFLEPIANQMLASWASSSWGGDVSIVMQEVARNEFGLENTYSRREKDSAVQAMREESGNVYGTFRALVRAMYGATQEVLAEEGADKIMLFRGVRDSKRGEERVFKDGEDTVSMAPLSSWSLDSGTAADFAGNNGHLLVAMVPRERVIATPFGGLGCMNEFEMVILGGDLDVSVIDMLENIVDAHGGAVRAEQIHKHSERAPAEKGEPLVLVLNEAKGAAMVNIDDIDPDWIKEMSWDLPTDWKGFLAAVGSSKSDVKSFLALPAAAPMPKALKLRAIAYARGA